MTASTTRCRPAFLLALLAALLVAVPQAAVSVDWPTTSLRFDTPATQIVEELTTEKASYTDPLVEPSLEISPVVTSAGRLTGCEPSSHGLGTELRALAARAPPSA